MSWSTRAWVFGVLLILIALFAFVVQPRDWMEARGLAIGAIVVLLIGVRIVGYIRYR